MDDGAKTLEQALRAIDALVACGVRRILTTPHEDGSRIGLHSTIRRWKEIHERWASVVEDASARHPDVSFHLGAEILLDHPDPPINDASVLMDRGPYVMVEYPLAGLPPHSTVVLDKIHRRGFRVIVAHVERYRIPDQELDVLERWRDAGARFQTNAGSLMGQFGLKVQERAWWLFARGWIDLVASDHHARGKPKIGDARDLLLERGADEQVRLLFHDNPERIVSGETMANVPPWTPSRNGWWSRLRSGLLAPGLSSGTQDHDTERT